jgi:Phosphotransferase enzyme family
VILDVVDLVTDRCGLGVDAADLRVAFVKTTDPLFLLFSPRQAHPRFVVKVGVAAELQRRLAWKSRLYALMPDAIARPLGVFPLDAGLGMLVQEGLAGAPWFRLQDRLRTAGDWLALRGRCAEALRRFQTAVSSQPDWVVPATDVAAGIRDLTARLAEVLAPHASVVDAALRDAAGVLETLGPVPASFQHGDFVLNNLLVGEQRLAVLDLVDFGKWRVPLLDAFALGCSVHVHASAHVPWHHVSDDLAACAAAAPDGAGYTPRHKTAFFAYFLLAAISDTLQRPSRATIRLTYLDYLRDLGDEPRRYVRAFERQA